MIEEFPSLRHSTQTTNKSLLHSLGDIEGLPKTVGFNGVAALSFESWSENRGGRFAPIPLGFGSKLNRLGVDADDWGATGLLGE